GMFLQRRLAAAVGKGQTAVIRPGTVGRQVATAMGGAELQGRKAIQCPFKNEMGERDSRFERSSDDVGQQAVALQPFLEVRNPLGMEENQGPKFLRLGPKGVKLWVRQLLAVDAPPDRGAAQPQLFGPF